MFKNVTNAWSVYRFLSLYTFFYKNFIFWLTRTCPLFSNNDVSGDHFCCLYLSPHSVTRVPSNRSAIWQIHSLFIIFCHFILFCTRTSSFDWLGLGFSNNDVSGGPTQLLGYPLTSRRFGSTFLQTDTIFFILVKFLLNVSYGHGNLVTESLELQDRPLRPDYSHMHRLDTDTQIQCIWLVDCSAVRVYTDGRTDGHFQIYYLTATQSKNIMLYYHWFLTLLTCLE